MAAHLAAAMAADTLGETEQYSKRLERHVPQMLEFGTVESASAGH